MTHRCKLDIGNLSQRQAAVIHALVEFICDEQWSEDLRRWDNGETALRVDPNGNLRVQEVVHETQ